MFIALLVLLASVGIATAGPDAAAPSADAPGATAPTAAEAPRIAGSDDGVVEVDWRNQPPRIHNANLFAKSIEGALGALTYYGAYDNPVERARVGRITYELAQQSRYRDFPMSIFLIDMPVPNAFALPGGHLFITRGMLDLGLTDDMLACLIGHEIAHVTERHGVRLQRRATLLNLLSQALLVGVLLGVDDEPENPYDPIESRRSRKGDLVQGTAAAGMVFSELLMRSHSRDFEDAADLEGQRLAAAAGYDPRGAQQLWDLMQKRVPQSESYGYWRTHPFSSDRLRAAGARADELTIQPPRPADDFRAMSQQVILSYKDALPPSLLRMVLPPPRDQRTERTPDQRVPQPRRPGQVDPRAQLDEQARRAAVCARGEAIRDRAAHTPRPKGHTADPQR
ncbi:MAG: M48 family metallopeptidase, partial [Acidobacteriota bacterium]